MNYFCGVRFTNLRGASESPGMRKLMVGLKGYDLVQWTEQKSRALNLTVIILLLATHSVLCLLHGAFA